jgi:hypothetical protein
LADHLVTIMWQYSLSLSLSLTHTHTHKLNSVAVVRKRTVPTERPPIVGEVSANLCW